MSELSNYLKKYGFEESQVYLLELIPLIEMIWADGTNQEEEIKLLYRFTVEHLSRLSRDDANASSVSEKDINDFINRFIDQAPDPDMLRDLREACYQKLQQTPPPLQEDSKRAMINYCMDIAAACVKAYPYKFDERVVNREKALLIDIIENFQNRLP